MRYCIGPQPGKNLISVICGVFVLFAISCSRVESAWITPRVEPPDLKDERFEGAFYAHEPTYATLGGGEGLDAKFQISFKLRIWDHIFFGYTQSSVWDLYKESSPFRDTSYRPSFFYYKPEIWGPENNSVGLAVGAEHESNGKAGAESRSINIAFIRPLWSLGDRDAYHWRIAPKLYAYIDKDSTNGDIQKYRGYGDFYLALRHPEQFEIALTARQGTTSDHRSVLAELSAPFKVFDGWPIFGLLKNLPGYFYVQSFWGWGETLLEYNIKGDAQLRVGIAAVRDTWAERKGP
jgi:outer membrane phospholipase A